MSNIERIKKLKKVMSNLVLLEKGKFKPKKEPIFMNHLARTVRDEFILLAKEKEIEIKYDIPDLNVIVADQERSHEVISILLDNAIRFTPEGGRIEITGSEDDEFVEIIVKDNGIGIPVNEQERIFEPFYQLESILQHKEGFGLGLSIAKGIIESHGGSIRVESEPGKGSSFYFRIPRGKNNG